MDASPPKTVRSVPDLRAVTAQWRAAGEKIALVPTMGALHEGHATLVREARKLAPRVIVSIFVNPKQFAPTEDFDAYPRREASDVDTAFAAGASLVFAPGVADMYPPGFATTVGVAGVSEGLCGAHRPGHFDGVATVVSKLLIQAMPDEAMFGEKDFQQLRVIERLARDLDLPMNIRGVPTVREADGLALSSRNAYLTPEQRRIAPALAATLHAIAIALSEEPGAVETQLAWGKNKMLKAGFDRVEYMEVRNAQTLAPLTEAKSPARILAACHLGATRLIDNVPINPAS